VSAPGATMAASLATLKDVGGITGSFVFTRAGRVVARELPSLFDDGALAEAGGRLARLRETFAVLGDALDVAVIRFGEHKLYLKALDGGVLCIVADRAVNLPAMRMAANLVGRRIAAALDAEDAAPPPPLPLDESERPAAPRPTARAQAVAPPGMRRFRGRMVE